MTGMATLFGVLTAMFLIWLVCMGFIFMLSEGMRNLAAMTIAGVMFGFIILGAGLVMTRSFAPILLGIVLMTLGLALTTCFNTSKKPAPGEARLQVIFGQTTAIRVDRLTMTLTKFVEGVVDVVAFSKQEINFDIAVSPGKGLPFVCKDGKNVIVTASITLKVATSDDPIECMYSDGIVRLYRDCDGNWYSGGQKVQFFSRIGTLEKARDMIDDMLAVHIQAYANMNSSIWMQKNFETIASEIYPVLAGDKKCLTSEYIKGGRIPLIARFSNIRMMGVAAHQLQFKCTAPEEVTKARTQIETDKEKRKSIKVTTDTYTKMIKGRIKAKTKGEYDSEGNCIVPPVPVDQINWKEERGEVFEEVGQERGDVKIVKGARTVIEGEGHSHKGDS